MGVRARIADGAMAGTAWSPHRENWAGLRPASCGSAKPGRMTRRQANVSAAPFSCPAGCAEDPIMDVSPGRSRHGGPQGRRRFLAVRLYWASARGPQRRERCLPLPGPDHAERRDSRREGTTSEPGVLPVARLRRAVPAGGRRSKPSPPSWWREVGVPWRAAPAGGRPGSPGGGSKPSPPSWRPEVGVPWRAAPSRWLAYP